MHFLIVYNCAALSNHRVIVVAKRLLQPYATAILFRRVPSLFAIIICIVAFHAQAHRIIQIHRPNKRRKKSEEERESAIATSNCYSNAINCMYKKKTERIGCCIVFAFTEACPSINIPIIMKC